MAQVLGDNRMDLSNSFDFSLSYTSCTPGVAGQDSP
jgi:hypothetical protein